MKKLTNRNFQEFRTSNGSKFYACLTPPNSYVSTSKYPKRILQVQEPSPVSEGSVVDTPFGTSVLLMEFVSMINGCKSFVAAHVNDALTWVRPVLTQDPVSKQYKETSTTNMGTIYTSVDQIEDLMIEHKRVDQYTFYTGQDVHLGDRVDGKLVINIRETLGVKFVTTK